MQTASRIVGSIAEFCAGMKLGEDNFDTGQTGFRLDVNRDASTIVVDLD